MARERKRRLRAGFPAGAFETGFIDKENGVLRSVLVVQEGEATGHGVWLGSDFVLAVVDAGNAAPMGVKVRFGHPAMCADALGTYVGRARNFRLESRKRADGTVASAAVADVHISDEAGISPKGDLRAWLLKAAEESPASFGMSIVFTYADQYVFDPEGGAKVYRSARDKGEAGAAEAWSRAADAGGRVYAVLDKLIGADFTDSPAATDGVFSVDSVAGGVEEFLDDNPAVLDALTGDPARVAEFIARFNSYLESVGRAQIVLPGAAELAAKTAELEAKTAELEAKTAEAEAAEAEASSLRIEADRLRDLLAVADAQDKALHKAVSDARAEADARVDAAEKAAAEAEDARRDALALAEEERRKRAALVGGALAPPEGADLADFRAAIARFGYVDARRRFPDLYRDFMHTKTQNTKKEAE